VRKVNRNLCLYRFQGCQREENNCIKMEELLNKNEDLGGHEIVRFAEGCSLKGKRLDRKEYFGGN